MDQQLMSKVQLNRLQKLHDFVKSEVKPKYFHMSYYRANEDGYGGLDGVSQVNLCTLKDHTCGTVGCLMGWAPIAFKSTLSKAKLLGSKDDPTYRPNFMDMSEHLFGIGEEDPRWNYLFDSDWANEEDRAKQKRHALKRIKNMIKAKGFLTSEMKQEMRDNYVSYHEDYLDDDEDI